MPTYVYACQKCDLRVEVMHSIAETDNPTKETIDKTSCECVDTNGGRFERVPTSFNYGKWEGMSPRERQIASAKRAKEHDDKHIKEKREIQRKNMIPVMK